MLVHRCRLFVRRGRRLIQVIGILLGETLYLNLTVSRRPAYQRLLYRAERQSVACRRALKAWGIRVITQSRDNVDRASLIASNHLGIADVFLISSAFPVATSGKAELMRIPVVGWVCRSIAMIPVHRSRKMLSGDFAAAVAERLDAGVNVLVFPEGTTSSGTDVLPFKTGGFAAIEGTSDRSALPISLIVRRVDDRVVDPTTHEWFTWSDPNQSLFAHFWRLLGIRSAVVEILAGSEIGAKSRSRKELADMCYSEVSRLCKS